MLPPGIEPLTSCTMQTHPDAALHLTFLEGRYDLLYVRSRPTTPKLDEHQNVNLRKGRQLAPVKTSVSCRTETKRPRLVSHHVLNGFRKPPSLQKCQLIVLIRNTIVDNELTVLWGS